MKKHLLKHAPRLSALLWLMLMALLPAQLSAREFEYEGLKYTVLDEVAKTVEVSSSSTRYAGDIVIPATVSDGESEYSVTSIGEMAFSQCTGLTSIEIPSSVTSIGDGAFNWCSNLNNITVEEGNTKYTSIDGVLYNYEKTTLLKYPEGKTEESFSIPNSVTTIYDRAFYNCTSLTNIEIPNSVTTIGDAFSFCTGLTSIEIPNSVTSIGSNAFFRCDGLTSIEIPNSVTSIGNKAFYNCPNLTKILIRGDQRDALYYGTIDPNNSFSSNTSNEIVCIVPAGDVEPFKALYPNGTVMSNNIGFQYAGTDNRFEIMLNDSKTLSLSMQEAANVNGFQMDIELPDGLGIAANESGKLDVSFGADCAAASHSITAAKVAGNNRYRIVAFSSSNEAFTNGEGLLNIAIAAAQTLSGGDIKVEDIVLSLSGNQSFEAEPLSITVPSVTAVDNIKITPSTADVNLGTALRLTAEVSPSTASVQTVTWTSSNEKYRHSGRRRQCLPCSQRTGNNHSYCYRRHRHIRHSHNQRHQLRPVAHIR